MKDSPDNIAAIIAGYRQLQQENADLKADYLRRNDDAADRAILLREALAALEPFRQFAVEDLDQDRPDLPDDCGIYAFKAGDFRRARSIHAKIKKELSDA